MEWVGSISQAIRYMEKHLTEELAVGDYIRQRYAGNKSQNFHRMAARLQGL